MASDFFCVCVVRLRPARPRLLKFEGGIVPERWKWCKSSSSLNFDSWQRYWPSSLGARDDMTFSPVNQSDTCQTWASLRTCMWKRAVRTLSSVSHSRCSNDGESWKWLGTGKLDGNGLFKKKKKNCGGLKKQVRCHCSWILPTCLPGLYMHLCFS